MLRPPARKPKRVYSGLAAVGGMVLIAFEWSRLHRSGGEGWFWIAIGALMIVLGLIGVFQRHEEADDV